MDIVESETGEGLQLALGGDLDIYSVAEVHARVAEALQQSASLVLDLSGVDNIDGAGLQLLMAGKRAAAHDGKALHLAQHSACVIEALELCQLERFFGDPLVIRPKGGKR
ncbi:STAS domain-containing protein [Acidihalobacter prosperus]|uniref:STAS domain-containing protein n=1 Tax=Acidihalobacter prosperus TaxID=160660 RepID=A0A1A6C5N0_9GAMM|nr:STAS domain-containing protein [Acidihalobacter prosperus]OBS09876.1 hypothetical protein Thpro_020926 [Acidihalobacter prosperus]